MIQIIVIAMAQCKHVHLDSLVQACGARVRRLFLFRLIRSSATARIYREMKNERKKNHAKQQLFFSHNLIVIVCHCTDNRYLLCAISIWPYTQTHTHIYISRECAILPNAQYQQLLQQQQKHNQQC